MSRPRAAAAMLVLSAGLLAVCMSLPVPAAGQETPSTTPDLSELGWRSIGPGVTGGRIVDFAVVEEDPDVFYVATATGGAWKTTNGGDTWEAVFERQERSAIGGIAVAPGDRHTVWIGTGEPNARNLRSSSWGNGVYRSRDGGKSWSHMGLEDAWQIGRIVIDPRDPDVVFVSVLGSMWTTDPERNAARGLWRTRDAGDSWHKVLDAGERAGVVEVVLDPTRPDRLYAASWQRERFDWSFVGRGPDSGLFASRDGGDSWQRLDRGLPKVPMGRSGLSVCGSAPDTVYAVVDAEGAGGLYRSDDGGASWEHRSDQVSSSMYYGQVRCDPTDPERVYVLGTRMSLSTDGGTTFSTDIVGRSVHVDHHALWIDPADPERLLLGNDGGVYSSRDRGRSWRFAANLPITQFYTVAVDDREPFYRVYGGTQDNNSLGGPSGTRNAAGIVNADWYVTVGGDGFFLQIDPDDPDIVYTESQYGNLVRFDAGTGDRKRIQPQAPEGEQYRWNWSAPVLLSSHVPRRLYFGAQYLFRSGDRGDSWERISPDLTRALEVDPETAISDYGTLRVIAESPFDPDLLAVGTDDGLLQVTEDGGGEWRTAAPLPDVPETWQIVRLILSGHEREVLYAAASGHEFDDVRPHLLRSPDLGRSWERIDTGLPEDGPIRALAEHPAAAGLLFAGTEHGVHVTFDAGDGWQSLGNDVPTVPIHDMVVQPRTGDLVLGTHGRGIWILDSTTALVALATGDAAAADLFVRGPAYRLVTFDRGKGNQGDSFYRAPNPPEGAIVDVWLAAGSGAEDADADVKLEVRDADGDLVRTLDLEPGADVLRRRLWDLRTDRLYVSPGEEFGRDVQGPRVLPGTYRLRLTVDGRTREGTVEVLPDPDAGIDPQAARRQFDAALAAGRSLGRAQAAAGTLSRLASDVAAAREVADTAGVDEAIGETLRDLRERTQRLEDILRGGPDRDSRPVLPTLGRLYAQLDGSPAPPTEDELRSLEQATATLDEAIVEIEQLGESFAGAARRLDAAGAPWSPGRTVRQEAESGPTQRP